MTLQSKTLQRRPALRVAGLTLRTDNATEAQPEIGKIPRLWQRFRTEDWFDRLGKLGASGPPIGVYSAYDSDASGSYQLTAGREIPATLTVAAPLQIVSVPAGAYLAFQRRGPLPGSVIRAWEDVWAYFERPDAPSRAYTY